MPLELDFIQDPRYAVRNLSEAIVETPNEYSMLTEMGLFPEKGISVTYVEIEVKKGTLSVIPFSTRGAPAPKVKRDRTGVRMLPTLFQQIDDRLEPSDLQNLRMPFTDDTFDTFDRLLAEKVDRIQRSYRMTHEYLRWMALTGDVTDPATGEFQYNCYTEMGVAQAAFDFKFGTTTTNEPLAATKAVRRYLEKNRRGEPMSGLVFFAGSGFMDKLTEHPAYVKMYEQQQAMGTFSNHPLFEDKMVFKVGSTIFVEHNGYATLSLENGTEQEKQFIASNEAIGVPLGTATVFRSYYAPGDMLDAVNMPGLAMYASLKQLDHGKGIEIHTESAPFFAVNKPQLVVKAYSSN